MSVTVLDSAGAVRAMATTVLPDGSQAPSGVLVDVTGVPVGTAANPLRFAPAISAVGFLDRSGAVATPGSTILSLAADPTRKGGYFRASNENQGQIVLTFRDGAGNVHIETLEAGAPFELTINPGYVLQCEIDISGTLEGDVFSGVIYR